jgi:hypothetical protein
MKLVRLITIFLKETLNNVRIGKHLFPYPNYVKQDDLSPLLFNFALGV